MADLLTQLGSTETSHGVSDWNNGRPQKRVKKGTGVLFRDSFITPVSSLNHFRHLQTVPIGESGLGMI